MSSREAQKEIQQAQKNLDQTRADAEKAIREASPEDKEKAKTEAAKDIADAQKKLDEERMEAAKELRDKTSGRGALSREPDTITAPNMGENTNINPQQSGSVSPRGGELGSEN